MTLTDADRRKRYVRLASTLCYVEGAFMALSTLALGIPALASDFSMTAGAMVVAMAIVASGFIVAARRLRAHRRSGGVLALIIVGGSVALRLLMIASLVNVWFVVDSAILILVLLGWPELAPSSPDRAPVG